MSSCFVRDIAVLIDLSNAVCHQDNELKGSFSLEMKIESETALNCLSNILN